MKTKNLKSLSKYILVIILFLFSVVELSAQDYDVDGKFDWKLVEIKIMEQKDPPSGYDVTGERVLKSKKSITKLSDLSKADRKKIKKKAAKQGSWLVFVDTKGLWGNAGGLYYYWVKLKTEP